VIRDAGFTTVYWRMLWEGHPMDDMLFFSHRTQAEIFRAKKDVENTPYRWDPHELRWPIEVAHRLGMKLYAWVVPYNDGAPPGATAEYGVEAKPYRFAYGPVYETQPVYQWKFVRDHPEYQLVDRAGKRHHYGVLEWAHPEARRAWLDDIRLVLDRYDVDGLYVDTRTECMSPEYADQYGFNPPVVEEYRRRYGVNILEEDFDLEKWRALRGEYFTLFLKEISDLVHAKGKPLSMGTSRGDYIGFPLGNMKLEWRKWIAERIVDEFHIDEHGWAWGKQGYGYVTDFATGRGLKPYEAAIREDYGPLCKKSGVKLLFKCSPYRPRPLDEPCCHGRSAPAAKPAAADWCDRVRGMTEFDGSIDRPPVGYK
jgi:hypothetical protein